MMRMWSFQSLLSSLCIALSCVSSAAGLIHVSGYEGSEANVSCGYGAGYESYEKYLCRGDCGDNDVLITTTGRKKDKYSISDDKGTRRVTTTISNLSFTDAGKYWCGVTRNGKDIYSEVRLQVVKDTCCDQSTEVVSYETGTASLGCSYEPGNERNLKYFCRGQQPSTCLQQALVTSDSTKQNRRISLTDDTVSRRFTVTIGDLSLADNGSYLCGIRRDTGLDVFSAVELEIKEWCCVTTIQLSGTVGHPLTMQCTYSPQHRDKRKFFCRGEERSTCEDMVTSGSRFTLQDDVSTETFSVTVTELKADDAATYWCGSDPQWSVGQYTKIQLSLVFPKQTSTQSHDFRDDTTPHVTTSEGILTPSYATSFYPAVFSVAAALLILTLALVIVYKCKSRKVQGAGNDVTPVKNISVTETVMDNTDVYTNEDIIFHSKQRTHKLQKPSDHYDDVGEDPDSLYQNFSTADDIYCNDIYVRTKK